MTPETSIAKTYHFQEVLPLDQVQDLIKRKECSRFGLQDLLKMRVGWELAMRVKDGETIGFGSGTTAEAAIRAIGMRLASGEITSVKGVATSRKLGDLATGLGITTVPLETAGPVSWGFDGADEVEVNTDAAGQISGFRLIKGGGGAHKIERDLALRCQTWVVIVDKSKIVDKLGEFPLAVEVEGGQAEAVKDLLTKEYKPESITEKASPDGSTFYTDGGNIVLRVKMGKGRILSDWEQGWREIDGVVDTGLFVKERQPSEVLVSNDDGTIMSLEKGQRI